MDPLASLPVPSLVLPAIPLSNPSRRHHKPRLRWTTFLCASSLFVANPALSAPTSPISPASPMSPVSPAYPTFPTITAPPALDAAELEMAVSALVVEEREPPVWEDGHWTMLGTEERELRLKRATQEKDEDDEDQGNQRDRETPTTGGTRTTIRSHDTSMVALTVSMAGTASRSTQTPTAIVAEAISPLPSPFDGAAAYNFTAGSPCPTFINDMLLDDTFKSCYPFSMLIQTSRGLFNAAKSLVELVNVLDAACSVSSATCADYLTAKADALVSETACAAEYAADHPMVLQAYDGLRAYQTVYSATCLQDPSTSSYCYANAMTNLTSTDDAYLYFLPYNMSLSATTTPSCSWCTQSTLEIFRSAAADRSQGIADTYEEAATQVDDVCGGSFIATTLPEEISQGAAAVVSVASLSAAVLIAVMGSIL